MRGLRMAAAGCVVLFSMSAAQAQAAGFNIVDHGARSMGRAGAFVAAADDGSALYFNPAGLPQIDGNLFQADLVYTARRSKYVPAGGTGEKITGERVLPNIYYVGAPASEKWKWGVGVFTPFGSSTEWSENGPLRYQATFSEMSMIAVNPALGMEINPQFSWGAGLNIYESSVISRKMVDYGKLIGQPGKFDALYSLESSKAHALGYNLGLLYKFDADRRLGFSYRSGFSIYYKGTGVISNIPSFAPGSPMLSSPGKAKYEFPDEIMLGYAHRFGKNLELEADIQWSRWSRHKEVTLEFADRPSWNTYTPKNWHDALIYKLGAEYSLDNGVSLRTGYAYSATPVPPVTFEPANPDARRHSFYLGCGLRRGNFFVDLAGSATFFADRHVDNDIGAAGGISIDGTYKTFIPQISLGAGWNF